MTALIRLQTTSREPEAVSVATDVTSHQDMEKLAAVAMEKFGRIDVLINNAWDNAAFAYRVSKS